MLTHTSPGTSLKGIAMRTNFERTETNMFMHNYNDPIESIAIQKYKSMKEWKNGSLRKVEAQKM